MEVLLDGPTEETLDTDGEGEVDGQKHAKGVKGHGERRCSFCKTTF